MRRLLGLAAAMTFVLGAALAHADEATGTITQISLTDKTFAIGDKIFAASPENTVGPKLEELQVGDKVTVFYERATNGAVSNATSITKK